MTCRVEQFVNKFSSPVIVKIGKEEKFFKSGSELAGYSFDRSLVITDMIAKEDTVMITLAENDRINDMNWGGEEPVGFF